MDAVLNWIWQGTTVAAVLFVVLRTLEHARANIRYIVCCVTLLIVLGIPALRWLSSASGPSELAPQVTLGPMVSIPSLPWTSLTAMLGLWALWAGVQSLRLSVAFGDLWRARRGGLPFPAAVERRMHNWMRVRNDGRRARLVVSDAVGTAAVLGGGHPTIGVAPSLVERLSAEELDSIVIHEWAHVQRRDDLVALLQLAGHLVAGWHPAVWWIDRHLQLEREVACDEMAVSVTGSAKSYASCLLKLADLSAATRVPVAAPGFLSLGGLRHRVTRIVSDRPVISPVRAHGIATAAVVSLSAVSMVVGGLELFAMVDPPLPGRTVAISGRLQPPLKSSGISESPMAGTPETAAIPKRPGQARSTNSAATDAPAPERPETPQIDLEDPPDIERVDVNSEGAHPLADESAELGAGAQPGSRSADPSPTSWTAAAEAGSVIGRRSKAAGLATATAFSRFARRVAGSF